MTKDKWMELLLRCERPVARESNFGLLTWLGGEILQKAKLKQLSLQAELIKVETEMINAIGDNMKARLRLRLMLDSSFQRVLATKQAAEEIGLDLMEEMIRPEVGDDEM